MSSVSAVVLLLLGVALLVAVLAVLIGLGRLPVTTMEPPASPWAGWRRALAHRPRRRGRGSRPDAGPEESDPAHPPSGSGDAARRDPV